MAVTEQFNIADSFKNIPIQYIQVGGIHFRSRDRIRIVMRKSSWTRNREKKKNEEDEEFLNSNLQQNNSYIQKVA